MSTGSSAWCSGMTQSGGWGERYGGERLKREGWDGGVGGRLKGEGIIFIADSLHCTAETNITLWSNYTTIKIQLLKMPPKKELYPMWPQRSSVEFRPSSTGLWASSTPLDWLLSLSSNFLVPASVPGSLFKTNYLQTQAFASDSVLEKLKL